jgi:hypothetical protein
LPLNFTKCYKAVENTPRVPKQGAKIKTFYKDKGPKDLISLKIEDQKEYCPNDKRSGENISQKIEGKKKIIY